MIHDTCNMGACDLPDMYALSPRASGIHIRQIPRAHVTTVTCTNGMDIQMHGFSDLLPKCKDKNSL